MSGNIKSLILGASDGELEMYYGSWRKLVFVMSWQKLSILPKVKWKVGDVPNELGNLDKEIPRQLELLPGFILLIVKLKRGER